MSYWDTSALVKLYALEPDSGIFEGHVCTVSGPIIISRVGLQEAYATFYRKEASGVLRPGSAETQLGSREEFIFMGLSATAL